MGAKFCCANFAIICLLCKAMLSLSRRGDWPCPLSTEQVLQAVDLAVTMHQNGDDAIDVPAYVDSNVSTKVVKLIQSYTGIINRMVWRKG